MDRLRDTAILLVVGGIVLGLDQLTKSWVRSRLAFGEVMEPIPALAPVFRIVHWENTGAAFGVFPDGGVVFAVIAVVVVAAIIYYFPEIPSHHWLLRTALVLQLGGALGNLVDRLLKGPVTDFISIGSLPVFNVADAAISVGVVLLILSMWLEEHVETEQEAIGAQASAEALGADLEGSLE